MGLLQRIGTGNWAFCLKESKGNIADGNQLMRDRIARHKIGDKEHVKSGAWGNSAYAVIDGQIYALRSQFNPFMIQEYAEQAVELHRKNQDFLWDNVKIEGKPFRDLVLRQADKDEKKKAMHLREVYRLIRQEGYDIASSKLGEPEAEVPIWEARGIKLAKAYGKILPDYGINSVHVYLPPRNVGNIVRGFWLLRLDRDDGSSFDCNYGGLYNDFGFVFRGSGKSAGGTPQKIYKGKVRISVPSLREVAKYARRYVPLAVRKDFEKGLGNLWSRK
jgi:hypothetical protein